MPDCIVFPNAQSSWQMDTSPFREGYDLEYGYFYKIENFLKGTWSSFEWFWSCRLTQVLELVVVVQFKFHSSDLQSSNIKVDLKRALQKNISK